MSGRRVNLQDLTRLLTQGRRSQDQSQDPSSRAEASEVGGPGNQDATTRPPEAVISPSGENIATLMSHTEDTQDGASSTGDSSGEFSQPKQLVEDTKGFPEGDPTNGNLTEFVHEVEFQHNTLLGKMQLLREALAQQLASTDFFKGASLQAAGWCREVEGLCFDASESLLFQGLRTTLLFLGGILIVLLQIPLVLTDL
ncbi:uncharacterized protein [Cherax quadricarinatus]|uniref:uncharacterized protein n=1 Tax=Cherax quadricarinatus TaxID=27406 RepID=UPI00387EB597